MLRLGINGRFLAAGVTGVQRFARELTARLMASDRGPSSDPRDLAVTLFLPAGAPAPDHAQCRVVRGAMRGHAWEQLELPRATADCDITLHLSGTAPMRGGPTALVVHDVLALTHPQYFSRRFAGWYHTVLNRVIPRAAVVITISEYSRRAIRERFGDDPRVVIVTQGLAPFVAPAPPGDVGRVRSRWNLRDRFLLATGRGDPRKNHAFLDGVVRELRRRGDDISLVITGAATPRVHGHCVEPQVDGVRFTGRVSDDEMRALYTAADALCFPSEVEGFGRPPFEAAACGTPSLVLARPDSEVNDTTAGHPVPPDPGAWADAIEQLRADAVFRNTIVQHARSATGGMSWTACADAVLAACRAAAASQRVVASP